MRYLAEKGSYSDFDTEIKVNDLEEYVPIKREVVIPIGSLIHHGTNSILINNDMIGLARDQSGNLLPESIDFLDRYQANLLEAYHL